MRRQGATLIPTNDANETPAITDAQGAFAMSGIEPRQTVTVYLI